VSEGNCQREPSTIKPIKEPELEQVTNNPAYDGGAYDPNVWVPEALQTAVKSRLLPGPLGPLQRHC
jgi:hypothetical protein